MVGGHLKVAVAAKYNIAVVCHLITSRRLMYENVCEMNVIRCMEACLLLIMHALFGGNYLNSSIWSYLGPTSLRKQSGWQLEHSLLCTTCLIDLDTTALV